MKRNFFAAVICASLMLTSITAHAENWMSRLSDSTPVWKVSIPGTHDSATGHGFTGFLGVMAGASMAKTQDKSIQEQWNAGIRCFDLRPAVNGSSLDIYHGILQTKLSMKSALLALCTLLDENPTEFCVVLMRHESDGDDNNSSWGEKMSTLLTDEQISNHLVEFKGNLTVRNSRGKILLLSRDTYADKPRGAYINGWTHGTDINQQMNAKLVNNRGEQTTLYAQDFYDSTDGKVEEKKETVVGLLEKMVAMRKKTTPIVWCINYCSAYSKTINLLGNKISSSDGYRDNAAKVHAAVLEYMQTQPLGGPMGIMIMDFAGTDKSDGYEVRSQELTNVIIESNFAEQKQKDLAREALQKAIEEAEKINPEILSKDLKARYESSYSTATKRLNSTSSTIDQLTQAAEELNGVVALAKGMDVRELESLYLEMQEWGYDDAIAASALNHALTQEEVTKALRGLVPRYKQQQATRSEMPSHWAMPSQSVVGKDDNTPATFVDEQKDGYYLYNVGTGRWFCGGDEWGAHAAVGYPGIKVSTPEDNYENGHYNSIVTWLCNGDWGTSNKLNNSGFCDTPGNAWKFWQKDATRGIYTISNNGSNQGNNESNGWGTKDLMGFDAETLARVNVHQADDNDPYNQWIFVTEAQRDQSVKEQWAKATPENPIDLTYKIAMSGFNQRERNAGTNQREEVLPWTCNHENYTYDNEPYDYNNVDAHRHIICERGNNHADFCCDIYDWTTFSLTQSITGLQAGYYRVKVQGYYNKEERHAYLVANGERQPLMYQRDEVIPSWVNKTWGRIYADNTWEAIECFQNGLYWNEVTCHVSANGRLTLGVKKDEHVAGDCLLFDNFRLEYIGKTDPSAITSVKREEKTSLEYDLSGRVSSARQRGIHIVDGKKMLR